MMEATHDSLTTEVRISTLILLLITNGLYLLSLHGLESAFNNEMIGCIELFMYISGLVTLLILPSWHIIPLLNNTKLREEKQLEIEIYKSDIARYILANIMLVLLVFIYIIG